MMLIDIDDERNCYVGMDGEYERWNINPNVLEEGRQRALLTDSEPQEDAVSRKDVIDLYKRGAEIIAKAKGISVEDMPLNGLDALMNLPPVTPKRKKQSSQYYNDGWIPVDDRLPENDDAVLISHKNGVTKAWWNGRFWTSATIKHYKTVSAWMPLPKRYSGE